MKYLDHKHPHDPENTPENPSRIFVCEECCCVFADEEIRRDIATNKWGHLCKAKNYKKEVRCESHLDPYMPEISTLETKEEVK